MNGRPDIEELFTSAIAIESPDERAAFIARVTEGDSAMFEDLNSLVQAHFTPNAAIDAPAQFFGEIWTAESRTPDVHAGDTVGEFTLREKIGSGGMGEVWRAEQLVPIRRTVAVKFVQGGDNWKHLQERFDTERQAMALMDHPHIAKCLAADKTVDGWPYFVMEYIVGEPITRFCDERRLTIPERLKLMLSVCRAVQHAHHKGIIHRDLKPANVLVTIRDNVPFPIVIDFGIAKAMEASTCVPSQVTRRYDMIGTLGYMSPEQTPPSAGDVDSRSDVYSLGVLLFELLTGKLPFDLQESALAEAIRMIRDVDPPRPSVRVAQTHIGQTSKSLEGETMITALARNLASELDWVVMKALEKDRERRYDTPSALAADLERYLNHDQVLACPPSRGYRLRKFIRRHRASVIGALAVLSTLIAGLVGTTLQMFQAMAARDAEAAERVRAVRAEKESDRQTQLADNEKRRAQEKAAIAVAVVSFVQFDLLRQADPEQQANRGFRPDPDVKVKVLVDRAAEAVEERFKDRPLVEAAVRDALGEAYRGIGEYDKAIKQLRRAVELKQQFAPDDSGEMRKSRRWLAHALSGAGRADESMQLFHRVLTETTAELGENDEETREAMNNLGAAYRDVGRFSEAADLSRKVIALDEAEQRDDHMRRLTAMNNLGSVLHERQEYAAAVDIYHQAVTQLRTEAVPDHPLLLTTFANLSRTLLAQGETAQARRLIEDVLKRRSEALGPDHPHTLLALNTLSRVAQVQGRADEALSIAKDVLERRRRILGWDHPATETSLMNLATLLATGPSPASAIALYESERDRRLKDKEAMDPSNLSFMQAFGVLSADVGRVNESIAILTQVRDARSALLGPDHPDTLATINFLGDSLLKAKRTDEALPLLEKVAETRSIVLGAAHPETLASLNSYCVALMEANRAKEAIPHLERLRDLRVASLGPTHTLTLTVLRNLASAYGECNRFAEAISILNSVVEEEASRDDTDPQDAAATLNNLAAAYGKVGRPEDALRAYQQSLTLVEQRLGQGHFQAIIALQNIGVHFCETGKHFDAGSTLEEALCRFIGSLGANNPRTHLCRRNLAENLRQSGDPAGAARWYLETLAALREAQPNDELRIANALFNAGECHLEAMDSSKALSLIEECLAIRKRRQAPRWFIALPLERVGEALQQAGRHAEAEKQLSEAYEGLSVSAPAASRLHALEIERCVRCLVKVNEQLGRADEKQIWERRLAEIER